ncbi:hypothetical protein KEM52_001360 [Ascosphaera acerosa]|nr:hypothetical protein KEM52_001360 [Ascosphaera acerosa]
MATTYHGQAQQPTFAQCDSYFVESAFPQARSMASYAYTAQCAQRERERAKVVARERQYRIAEGLSKDVGDEYREDVLSHMMTMDAETTPEVESIDLQPEIEWYMRPFLIDFLIEAHAAFHLLPSTLFLTVNLLDRYCSKRIVYQKHYQLVGCAALLIAAKYGDKKNRVPTIRKLRSMCCSLYDEDMFIQMEWHVLQTLGWTVGHPTVDAFLQMAVMDSPYDPETEHLALYILEISLFHREFVTKTSGCLARSALALAKCILGRQQSAANDWASGYDSATLVELSQHLMRPSQVLYRKYSSQVYTRVARVLETFLAKQASLSRASSQSHTAASAQGRLRCQRLQHAASTHSGGNVMTTTANADGTMVLDAARAAQLGCMPGALVSVAGGRVATPQKNHLMNIAVDNGYMTPPITPETSDAAVAAAAAAAAAAGVASAANSSHAPSTGASSTVASTIRSVSTTYSQPSTVSTAATGDTSSVHVPAVDVLMKDMPDAGFEAQPPPSHALDASMAYAGTGGKAAPTTHLTTVAATSALPCPTCPLSPASAMTGISQHQQLQQHQQQPQHLYHMHQREQLQQQQQHRQREEQRQQQQQQQQSQQVHHQQQQRHFYEQQAYQASQPQPQPQPHQQHQAMYQFSAGPSASARLPTAPSHLQYQSYHHASMARQDPMPGPGPASAQGQGHAQAHGHGHHFSLPVPIQPAVSFPEYNPFSGPVASVQYAPPPPSPPPTTAHSGGQDVVMDAHRQQYLYRQRQPGSTMGIVPYSAF